MNKLLSFITALGIPQTEAQKLIDESEKDDSTFDVQALVKQATDHQRNIFVNDTEIIDKFKVEEKGKQLDIITRDLKKIFGLSSEEIKDKDIRGVIELAKTKASTNTDKNVDQLQADIIALTNKVKDYEENIIPGKLAEVEGHKKKISIEHELTKLISGKKLRVPFDAAFPSIVNFLGDKFDLDIDDKKQLAIYLKGSKTNPLKEDKSGILGLNDILDGKLKEWKFIEESNADQGDKGTKQVIVDDPNAKSDKKIHYPGAEKALAAAAENKKAAESK